MEGHSGALRQVRGKCPENMRRGHAGRHRPVRQASERGIPVTIRTNLLPTQEVLLSLMEYDPDTGSLLWKDRPLDLFKDGKQSAHHNMAAWNAKCAGKPALNSLRDGYLRGRLLGEFVYAHRVIWKMMTGDEPDLIDHINGIRSNNRWCNLRSIDARNNAMNSALRSDNTSGVVGVTWDPRFGGKWVAQIFVGQERIFLGQYDEIGDAVRARKAAERKHNFHPNHGRQPCQ